MSVTDAPVDAAVEPPLETDIAPPRKSRGRGRLFVAYLITLFFLVNVNFFLPRLMPGDPLEALAGGNSVDAADRQQLEDYYGLGKPLVEQYFDYLGGLATGDLGTSISANRPVSDMIRARIGWSFLLVGSALSLAVLAGFVGGILSGWRRGKRLDRGLLGVFIGLGNLPSYFVAGIAWIVLCVKLNIFPTAGAQQPFNDYTGLTKVLDIAHHLVLPASVMAMQFAVIYYLVMRSSMVSELGADYLRLGRAKGFRERRLKYRYAGRNALLPAVTVVALDIGLALGITVFIERVFAYPGLGLLIFSSIGFNDYPLMQGCFLTIGFMVLTVNLVADLLYPRIDAGHHVSVSTLESSPQPSSGEAPRRWLSVPDEWREAARSPLFVAGAVIVGIFVVMALFAPLLSPYDPKAEFPEAELQSPSLEHLLGTNDRGQDILSQVIYGARASLSVALAGATLAVAMGTVVGVGAGLRGGGVDLVAMRLVDLLLALPGIPLLILIASLAGPSQIIVILIVATAAGPSIARVLRSQTLTLRERGFVHAARGFGAGNAYLLRRHLAPALGPLIVTWWLEAATLAIGLEAGLAFLGLADPSLISWGTMLDHAFDQKGLFFTDAWLWLVLPPGLAITFALLGFTFIGVGLEPVFNPRWGRTQ